MKNPTLLQCFHWYYPAGGELWREVTALAPNLNEIGINMIWLPPAYKGASGGYSVGYDSYDLFDLGEFDQKGSVATKYGDKAQLLEVKWFTEFGHLNRGDMLTSEQHRCHNEKKKFQRRV